MNDDERRLAEIRRQINERWALDVYDADWLLARHDALAQSVAKCVSVHTTIEAEIQDVIKQRDALEQRLRLLEEVLSAARQYVQTDVTAFRLEQAVLAADAKQP